MLDNCASDETAAERRRLRLARAADRMEKVLARSVLRIDRLSLAMNNDISLAEEDRVLKSLGSAAKLLEQVAALTGAAGAAPETGAARESQDDETRARLAQRIAALASAFEAGLGAG